jgi:hypothetical protein
MDILLYKHYFNNFLFKFKGNMLKVFDFAIKLGFLIKYNISYRDYNII